MRRITIKSRLYATAIGIFVILFIIGMVANFYISNALSHFDAMSVIKDVSYNELQMRKLEKDFINLETKNKEFYKNQRSTYQDNFNELMADVNNNLEKLKGERIITTNKLGFKLDILKESFAVYNNNFEQIAHIFLKKGFKDYGLIGHMREQIHAVESMLDNYPDHPEFKVAMLTLRRNEKDYLLRKDLKYLEKFKENNDAFKEIIEASNISNKQTLIFYLDDYYNIFEKVIQEDIQIGLTEDMGLIHKLNHNSSKIEEQVTFLQKAISSKAREEVNGAISTLFIISIILAIIIMSVLLSVTRRILYSIKKLRSFILRLGQGELPPNLTIKKNDEIADIIKSINALLENLRNTREFAIEVGNGNLEKQINVFNNEGDLGGALVGMRKQLLELAQEREKNEKEAQRRSWINEGVAKFADMLRQTENGLQELSYSVLSELINYIGANQGAIFIIEEENKQKHLELFTAVAYNRRKLTRQKVQFGEDLVGRCAFEKQKIYMKDVPEDYIKITSGLGYATPRIILLVPIISDDEVLGVLELASFEEIEPHKQTFVERLCINLGTTISTVKNNEKTQMLLDRAREQADEISSQEEELRQNMEEMKATQEEAARREHELVLELHAFQLSSAVIDIDTKGNIIKANNLAQELFNVSNIGMENRNVTDFITDKQQAEDMRSLIRAGNQKVSGSLKLNMEVHGRIYPVMLKLIPVADETSIKKIMLIIQKAEKSFSPSGAFNQDGGIFEPDAHIHTFN